MRLDKLLRERGIASRAETKQLVAEGRVLVNGFLPENHSMDCLETDVIAVDGREIIAVQPMYLMLHKPAGCVTATRDETEQTVMDLLPEQYRAMSLFPVGRLDKESEGLLLLTNDGSFCTRVIEPEHHVPKTYYIEVGRPFAADTEARFANGILFPNGTLCRPGVIEVSDDRMSALVTVTEGKTHQVRRMAAACGSKVRYLKRVSIGKLVMEDTLLPGQCRELSEDEMKLIFES
ncbi:MAG: 16S rRNA pseudouridine(516) synthase [Oscillospiraceae bacterium]|nr:16S rRNA pseudouridine(516) synthase [Oscillospiraceae bacterium]